MTAATATLVHTSSVASDNALRIARVAAGSRVKAQRVAAAQREIARRQHARQVALAWVADIVRDGAVRVGFKVCDDWGKHRFVLSPGEAVGTLTRLAGEDVEAWGIRADGEYCTEVW